VANLNQEKSIAMVVNELKVEVRDFVQTRLQILKQEMQSKAAMFKLAVPMLAVALLLMFVGFLCITGLFVVLIASAFQGLAGWMWAFLIVGGVYFIIAGACALFAWSEFKQRGLAPKHTLQVLKQDQIWLRNEAKAQM
jgi:uncharacterized membrane protein YqjE